jgi:hypothetical protein
MQHQRWPWEIRAIADVVKLLPEMEVWCSRCLFYWPSSGARMGDRNCTVIVTLWLGYGEPETSRPPNL